MAASPPRHRVALGQETMFGTLGGPEIFLILVIALIIFGPRKLPEIGKSVGKMLVEFRRASTDFKRTIEGEIEAERPRPSEPSRPSEPIGSSPGPDETEPAAAPAPEGAVPAKPSSSSPPAPPETAE